jgi:hypothetical protein
MIPYISVLKQIVMWCGAARRKDAKDIDLRFVAGSDLARGEAGENDQIFGQVDLREITVSLGSEICHLSAAKGVGRALPLGPPDAEDV